MVQVASSILSADFANLERDCRRVVWEQNPMLHFDVMDGVFVPNISIGLPVLQSLVKALPQAVYDVHLMIIRPHLYIDAFAKAGAHIITVHSESESELVPMLREIRARGCKAGVSIRPKTPVETLFPLLEELDMVLIMSVEPGFGGQSFIPNAPARIAAVKAEVERRSLNVLIEVDGGINAQTAPLCVDAGAEILVAGSAVFGAPSPEDAVKRIRGDIQ